MSRAVRAFLMLVAFAIFAIVSGEVLVPLLHATEDVGTGPEPGPSAAGVPVNPHDLSTPPDTGTPGGEIPRLDPDPSRLEREKDAANAAAAATATATTMQEGEPP
jgi:hypothetical protein